MGRLWIREVLLDASWVGSMRSEVVGRADGAREVVRMGPTGGLCRLRPGLPHIDALGRTPRRLNFSNWVSRIGFMSVEST